MRCAACGATNPEGASWCGQCYAPLGAPAPDAPPAAPPEGAAPADAGEPAGSGFRGQGDRLEWACLRCGAYNAIELTRCSVCGAGFAERYRSEEPPRPVNWQAALGLSMLLPGAGHLSAGRVGSGAARALLFLVWLSGAILLAGETGAGLAVAPLALGAALLWAGSVLDVVNLQRGRPEVLVGRTLLWLVIGVTGLLMVAVLATAISAAPETRGA
jgi:ribosomal protein L37E